MAATDPVDHVSSGVALLIDQYQDKPRLAAFLSAFLRRCNDIESALLDILKKRDLDIATGAQLDALGKIVGQSRIGATDDVYRLYIRVRILVNRSRGTCNDVMAVASAAIGSIGFQLLEFYPAGFVLDVLDPLLSNQALIASFVHDARSAGVGMTFQWSSTGPAGTFTFADGDVEQPSATQGWGSPSIPTAGGLFVDMI